MTIDAEDPAADPAEVALLRKDGNRMLVMLPLIAKGEAIGLVELFSRGEIHWPTPSAWSWPGRWPTRRPWPSRTRGCTRTPASSPTATR